MDMQQILTYLTDLSNNNGERLYRRKSERMGEDYLCT